MYSCNAVSYLDTLNKLPFETSGNQLRTPDTIFGHAKVSCRNQEFEARIDLLFQCLDNAKDLVVIHWILHSLFFP